MGSIPMWPCLPQGERPPLLLRRFFSHVLWQFLRPVSSHVCWLVLRNKCSFDFLFLQMPINRQATEGNYIHSNPKSSFVIPLKESQESSREERKIGSEN